MRIHGSAWCIGSALLLMTVGPAAAPALGQQTRDEALAAEQAEKATDLHPYVASVAEQRVERAVKVLTATPALYTFVGSVYPGGLFAVGPGFRHRYGDSGSFDVHGGWSLKNYKLVDASLGLPDLAEGRVKITSHAQWIDAPGVMFFGVGNESLREDRTSFSYRATTIGASGRVQPARFTAVGGGADFLDFKTSSESEGSQAPTYLRTRLFAEFDWRQSPGYTRRGGLYRIDWSNYAENGEGSSRFRRLDAELDQFVPLLRANWVLAFRALASFTDSPDGNRVPYFLLPDLGGSRMLRSYHSWRFRDRTRMLLTAEYRWTAGQFVDMALFLDAGQVAARARDIRLNNLRTGYGLGVRFHTPLATVLRAEIGRGAEGTRLIFAFGPSF
jgi:hypothetical protein